MRAADIVTLLGSETSARKVIRNLIRKGWLSRIVGGRYMLLPPEHGPENLERTTTSLSPPQRWSRLISGGGVRLRGTALRHRSP